MGLNDEWRRRSLAAVWHPCTQMKWHDDPARVMQAGSDVIPDAVARSALSRLARPHVEPMPLVPVQSASGVWLHDHELGRILDGISSWWVNLFGHNHPAICAALVDQLQRLDHVMLAGFTHEPVVRLSERLAGLTGLGHAFYASDGASAVEIALKMSAHYWHNTGRPLKCRFVGVAGGYHGETIGALGVTDIPLFREAYAPLLRLAAVMPSPDARHADASASAMDIAERAAEAVATWLEQHHATTAALIVEPLVQCAGAMAMHDAAYLKRLRSICDRHEVHLVVDEIAVGFGRTGSLFAHQEAGILPDFMCLSKGLTGGMLPLSTVLTTDKVFDAFHDDRLSRGFLHSHSFSGNPLACRAALATLDLFEANDTIVANVAVSERLWHQFEALTWHPRVRHARRKGMIFAWDVQTRLTDFARRYARHATRSACC